MSSYNDLSIRHKLQGIVMITCVVALFISVAALTFYERATFIREKSEDLAASAKMVGTNSTAALAFRDPASAAEILAALYAKQHVTQACIYDRDGKVFATYNRNPAQGFAPPAVQGEHAKPWFPGGKWRCSSTSCWAVRPLARYTFRRIKAT